MRALAILLFTGTAAAAPKPFFVHDTPRNPCDVKPPDPVCVAGYRAEWDKVVAGTHPRIKHVTKFATIDVYCTKCTQHDDKVPPHDRGWNFKLLVPGQKPTKDLVITIDNVKPIEDELHTRYVSQNGTLVIDVGVLATQLSPGAHTVTATTKAGKLFELPIELE